VNTYKETDMSEENAIPEAAPVEVPATPVVETPVVEVPNVEPAAPAFVAESAPVPLTEAESVAALSVEVATTLHDVFQYIHQGFDQHSLMIGMSRFYEIARAVKARAES
jgi:hypothetical protein